MLKTNFGMSECDSASQATKSENTELKYRGCHSMLDITKCYIKEKDTEATCLALFNGFKEICGNNSLRIVGEKMVVFDGSVSPPGFSFIAMLDESHISAHSYGEEGILAIDCFTCSKCPENHINAVNDIKKLISHHFPESEVMKHHMVGRFVTL
jgi:S-adenosylmethionine/arginine decarboxylase-like enzyme